MTKITILELTQTFSRILIQNNNQKLTPKERNFEIIMELSLQDGFDTKYMSNIVVTSNGGCTWMPPAIIKSSCQGIEIIR